MRAGGTGCRSPCWGRGGVSAARPSAASRCRRALLPCVPVPSRLAECVAPLRPSAGWCPSLSSSLSPSCPSIPLQRGAGQSCRVPAVRVSVCPFRLSGPVFVSSGFEVLHDASAKIGDGWFPAGRGARSRTESGAETIPGRVHGGARAGCSPVGAVHGPRAQRAQLSVRAPASSPR